MYGLQTIVALNSEATRAVRRRNLVPFVPSRTFGREDLLKIPMLGENLPKGWNRVNITEKFLPGYGVYKGDNAGFGAYFVDSSGRGEPGKASITAGCFIRQVDFSGRYGYGIVERGQFQVKIGVFSKAQS